MTRAIRLALLAVMTIRCTLAPGADRPDPLAPIVQCIKSGDLRVVAEDRLAPGSSSRTVETPQGRVRISLADGYRIAFANPSGRSPFVNLKIEKSMDSAFDADRDAVVLHMRGFFKDKPELAKDFTMVTHGAVEIAELYHHEPDRPTPSMYSFFVARASIIATAYVLAPPLQNNPFEDVAAYDAAKNAFAARLTRCLQPTH